jgi:hypothetical protein
MAVQQLQIKIGADVNGAVGNVNKLKFSLADLHEQLKAKQQLLITEKDITKIAIYRREVELLKNRISDTSRITFGSTLTNSITANSGAFDKLVSGANGAFSVLRKVAYILPGIGIAGIIGQFSDLAVELFKATVAGEDHSKSIQDQAKAIKEAKQQLEQYVETLDDVSKIHVLGAQGAQQELGGLQTLYTASQNLALSYGERKKAVDLLQERYPAYFANLSDEAILAGKAKTQYDKLVTSILAASTARAAQKELDTLAEQTRVIQQQREEADKVTKARETDYQDRKQKNEKEIALAKKIGESTLALENGIINKRNEYNKAKDKSTQLANQENGLLDRQKKISGEIQDIISKNGVKTIQTTAELKVPETKTPKVKDDSKELEKILKEKKDILLDFVHDFEEIKIPFPKLSKRLEDFDIKGLTEELRNDLNKALVSIAPIHYKVPVDVQGIDIKKLPRELKMPVDIQATIDKNKITEKLADDINEALANFQDAVKIEGLSTLGEAIGAALSGKDIGNVFKQFGQFLGGAVQQLGKQIIALNVAALAVKKSLKLVFTNPAVGIAAGAALVVIGAALKNLTGGGIKGFARGGRVPGHGSGDTVPAMLTPGEFVVTKDKAALAERLFGRSFTTPKISNGRFHFAGGGFVPDVSSLNDRAPISKLSNAVTINTGNQFPDYLPVFSMSHDQFRLWYSRANKYGNTFGR